MIRPREIAPITEEFQTLGEGESKSRKSIAPTPSCRGGICGTCKVDHGQAHDVLAKVDHQRGRNSGGGAAARADISAAIAAPQQQRRRLRPRQQSLGVDDAALGVLRENGLRPDEPARRSADVPLPGAGRLAGCVLRARRAWEQRQQQRESQLVGYR